jgi:hypothetical protein
MAEIVAKTVLDSHIVYAPDAGPDKRCYRVDFEKIRRILPAFKPHSNARLGAQQLYRDYCRVGLSLEDAEGDRYTRILHIRKLINRGLLDNDLRWSALHPVAVSASVNALAIGQ